MLDKTFVSDLFAEASAGLNAKRVVLCNEDTLNTPYKEGITGSAREGTAYINMTSANYGEIVYFPSGGNGIFITHKTVTWRGWHQVALKSDLPQFETSDVTSTVATAGVGCVARKYGKIVFLNVHLTFTSNVSQYEQIASTPYPAHLGKGDSYTGFAQFGSTSNVRRIYVAGTKLFTGSALAKGESLVGSVVYITV